jgi:PKD repeat protein
VTDESHRGRPRHRGTRRTHLSAPAFETISRAAWDGFAGPGAYEAADRPPPAPVAAFTATPASGTAPLTIQFTDQSTAATWS